MSDTTPTLKMRLDVSGIGPLLGESCESVAQGHVLGARLDVDLLDAKWGRPAAVWRETGGWGRAPLDKYDRGYIAALRDSPAATDPVIANLLRIISSVAS